MNEMPTILHIASNFVDGTGKYHSDLQKVFPEYTHLYTPWSEIGSKFQQVREKLCLVHIHCPPEWNTPNFARFLRDVRTAMSHVKIYITIHDYMWINPRNPTPILEEGIEPIWERRLKDTLTIFDCANKVIFPSETTLRNYKKYLKNSIPNAIVVPHCDLPCLTNFEYIPPIVDETINVAFVGHMLPHKGSGVFCKLSKSLTEYRGKKIKFHVFGLAMTEEIHEGLVLHGKYKEDELTSLFRKHNIHVACLLSLAEETYCYTATLAVNTGAVLVFMCRGALLDRFFREQGRFFPLHSASFGSAKVVLSQALDYVIANAKENQDQNQVLSIVKNDWYANHYSH
jgi:glycosyltransferase involved in cell wall biosynthesis